MSDKIEKGYLFQLKVRERGLIFGGNIRDYAAINFCHNYPPAHSRGFAPKICPHPRAFVSKFLPGGRAFVCKRCLPFLEFSL